MPTRGTAVRIDASAAGKKGGQPRCAHLSSGCTNCQDSGVRPYNRFPMSGCIRPMNDISKSLSGGPVAWEARLETLVSKGTFITLPSPFNSHTPAAKSLGPIGDSPLNRSKARPSQNWRWLNTALITVGVFRGSTRRMVVPLTLNTGSN